MTGKTPCERRHAFMANDHFYALMMRTTQGKYPLAPNPSGASVPRRLRAMTEHELPLPLFREMMHGLPDLTLLVTQATLVIVEVGAHGASELGWDRTDLVGKSVADFVKRGELPAVQPFAEQLSRQGTVEFDCRVLSSDEVWHDYNFTCRSLNDENLIVVGRPMAVVIHDDSRLADLVRLADMTDDLFLVANESGVIEYTNAAAAVTHGTQQFRGRMVGDFVNTDDDAYRRVVGAIVAGETSVEGQLTGLHRDGDNFMLGIKSRFDPDTRRWYTVGRDVTNEVDQRRELQRLNVDLRRRATTDWLTRVANRDAFVECVESAIAAEDSFAVLLLDMDDFKSVNDTLGHCAGDDFLRCVARRLQSSIALHDMVARLGGDEFVVFLPDADAGRAATTASNLVNVVTEPFTLGGEQLVRSCSVGGAVYEVGDDLSALLRKADQAAYSAKRAGRGQFAIHDGRLGHQCSVTNAATR